MNEFRQYPAPGKLNLMLRVVGRRADGYHLLQTVIRFIDYGDTVGLRVRHDGRVKRLTEIPGVEAETDLTVKAARLLREASRCALGVDIALDKRLPRGGGLGGGSSDAATALLALNQLWQLDLPRPRLLELGLQLGADVPVFVFGDNALAEGIGELLTPIAAPAAWYVVLKPPVAVSTAAVFAARELKRDSKPIRIQGFSVDLAVNDLEPLVCRLYPEVARHLQWLRQFGPAMMTGSGACVFAAFASEREAQAVLARLPDS
ncbi:MAG TPA: 4-(cytidine 5'-diphospho)-2-C-methyl-D-erythritol kinase, partial [Burkholderiales bacterium]|nr:4-(cytidine 5'-diphospho)-2-C-methyl-D-erythritol kinase [Burkholderiales bacterium]